MCHPAPTASADARLAGLRAEVCALADALADVDVAELSEGSLGETILFLSFYELPMFLPLIRSFLIKWKLKTIE